MEPLLSQYQRGLLFFFLSYSLVILTNTSLASTLPSLQCHKEESSALLQFRQSFGVDCSESVICDDDDPFSCGNKPKVASWKKDAFANSNGSTNDCCAWDGVTCDAITGHVVGLDLAESCLYGSFPQNSSLFKLAHLRHLNLGGNNFKYSHIPQDFGQLHNLKILNLSMSRFSGQIPLEISRLSNLHTLDLSRSDGANFYVADKVLKLHNPNFATLLNNLSRLNKLALDFVDIVGITDE